MSIIKSHGPLIDSGEIDGATYEVRGTTHPMIYVYRKTASGYAYKATQLGELVAEDAARMIARELRK